MRMIRRLLPVHIIIQLARLSTSSSPKVQELKFFDVLLLSLCVACYYYTTLRLRIQTPDRLRSWSVRCKKADTPSSVSKDTSNLWSLKPVGQFLFCLTPKISFTSAWCVGKFRFSAQLLYARQKNETYHYEQKHITVIVTAAALKTRLGYSNNTVTYDHKPKFACSRHKKPRQPTRYDLFFYNWGKNQS